MARVVVFDLDGTLSDSKEAIVGTFGYAFEAHGLAAPAAADVHALIGLPLAEIVRRLLPEPLREAEPEVTASYVGAYVDIAHAKERLYDGALALLDELADARVPLAIATGKSQHGAEAATRRLGIYDRFQTVRGISSVPRGKPFPDLLLAVLEDLGASADQALMIGDTTYDLDMARAADVAACGVAWGVHSEAVLRAREPHYFASSMDELRDVVFA
ncbi:MAG: HAD family hydrolase [Deltaproteobacteria bacterium]|nr:MAG: HAD family hydrolase [Deltaproteobacteria bacterium]